MNLKIINHKKSYSVKRFSRIFLTKKIGLYKLFYIRTNVFDAIMFQVYLNMKSLKSKKKHNLDGAGSKYLEKVIAFLSTNFPAAMVRS